jgi:hypothetical protein
MRWTRFLRDYYVVIPLVAILGYAIKVSVPWNWTSTEAVRRELRIELPPGSSKEDVVEYLQSDDWEFSEYGNEILALLRNTGRRQFYIRIDIQAKFAFTPEGRLIATELREVGTGF